MSTPRTVFLGALLTAGVAMHAQPNWSAAMSPVQQDGYYTVVLSPEVIGRSRSDLSDLRVLDSLGHEVPYILEREPAMYERTWMRPYTLLRNERAGSKRTVIEISSDSMTVVDELQLRIRNAVVNKEARITGSDDRSTWYMIQDQSLSVGEGSGATSVLRFVDLPLTDYRYYRIELNDSLTPPVHVLTLGHSARARSEGRYTPIDGLRFIRSEGKNATRIGLFAGSPFNADRIKFDIRNDGPFLRQGSFTQRTTHTEMQRRRKVQYVDEQPLGSFSLASYARGVIAGPSTTVDTLWIRIDNGNDQPLDIAGIHAFQLERRLVAKLKAGMPYTLTTADAKAQAPLYDLEHFRDSIPASIASLPVPALIAAPRVAAAEPLFAPGMMWVWAAIIGIGALIAFSAVRMMRKTANAN
jgi:hypothetical protein